MSQMAAKGSAKGIGQDPSCEWVSNCQTLKT